MALTIGSRGTLSTLPRTSVRQASFSDATLPGNQAPGHASRKLHVRNANEPGKDRTPVVDGVANVPLREKSPKLWMAFLAANLSVYAAGIVIALTVSNEASNEFFLALAKINSEVIAGEYWRMMTATFMHAGLLHLATNCGALWVVAPEAEAVYGSATFAALFLLSGAAGSVASFMLSNLVTVGASGAIFGLLGALYAYFLRNRRLQQSSTQLLLITALVGLNFALGFDEGSMVDNTGHAAGFLTGLWLGWNTCPRWQVVRTDQGAPPKKAFDWASPTAPGPSASTPTAAAGSSATDQGAAPGSTADGTAPAEPASPTIALLDALLPTPDAAAPSSAAPPQPPAAADTAPKAPGEVAAMAEPPVVTAVGAAGSQEGAGQGGGAGREGAGGRRAVIDLSRPVVGKSVLVSFGVSLIVLTWAGCVAGANGGATLL
eukprot:jgi/Ulvmu1/5864/UM025_0126.1